VSDPWETGADDSRREGGWSEGSWGEPRGATRREGPSSGDALRRHSQPRHSDGPRTPVGVETGPEGVPVPPEDDVPAAWRVPVPVDPDDDVPAAWRVPVPVDPDDDVPAAWRVPGGRRPDPSSLDPGLAALRAPLDDWQTAPPASPAAAPAVPFHDAGPGAVIVALQPASRLRVGPRHGSGQRREDLTPKTPLRAAVGAGSEIIVVLGMALLLSLLIKTFLVQAFFIPSSSMENTLLIGDRVLVSKLTPGVFELHRGDVVVFKDPGGWLTAERGQPAAQEDGVGGTVRNALSFVGLLPQDAGEHLIKRVIGLGGDHVVCCVAKGRITVNGAPIDETPYLLPGAAPSDKGFDVTVPYGYLWVMGDNRPVSADSRLHRALNNGMVPLHDVVGKAFVIVWPFERAGGLGTPGQVFARVPDAPAH
jgi:signal peptidase I